ncbi:MAG: hypothetical protein FWB74_04760 [Defluviitaleaceae bacterium]|nr:hypothetical protein [Defluviitaleaceae bacterium]
MSESTKLYQEEQGERIAGRARNDGTGLAVTLAAFRRHDLWHLASKKTK